tara:strand:+ start:45475 stop:46572 length:1098 start_codon:yes stop_codon:yes gene_type:complete
MSGLELSIKRRLDAFELDATLAAPSGITGIIGPSGAGKSMLLRCIAGLQKPDHGQIRFDDIIFSDSEKRIFMPAEDRRVGFVFQDACLFPHMNVADNLAYGTRRRAQGNFISRDDVIDLLGLEHLLARRPHHLSGGEAQRVSIGRALLSAPRLLLMDEPLSSLDPRRRRDILPFLEAMHRRLDLPIVYVSHNIDEITRLADRVTVLHKGKVAASGGVADVLNRPSIQKLVLGEDNPDPASIIEAEIESHSSDRYVSRLSLGANQTISVPLLDLPVGTLVRLRIHARDVALATVPPQSVSIQNIIETEIADIADAPNGQVDIILSLTPPHMLTARITMQARANLHLQTGMKVWALIKSVALTNGTA